MITFHIGNVPNNTQQDATPRIATAIITNQIFIILCHEIALRAFLCKRTHHFKKARCNNEFKMKICTCTTRSQSK